MNNTRILLIILAAICLVLLLKFMIPSFSAQPNDVQTASPQPQPSAPKQFTQPETVIDPTKTYLATLKTEIGDIVIQLDSQKTPITTNNFVFLAQQGFYNQTIFHRVINRFMIQGGDPLGTGSGGPGYKFDDEPITLEYTRGAVAMANAGPNTNGSQFFIMHVDNPLPKNYVIFGHVTEGLDVVDAIATAPVVTSPTGENSHPVKPVTITTVTITAE